MPGRESSLSSVQKACRILGVLADTGRARLTEISVKATLNKVTTLRILEVLAREGYVKRDEQNKTYRLGDQSLVLASAARTRDDLCARARASLVRLAALSEDTVLLSVRQGCESVCIDQEIGGFPIRAAYLDVGSRRPVGVGAGALAVFAWLPDEELQALLSEATSKVAAYPAFTVDSIWQDVELSRSKGYAILLNRVVERMGAIGVPIIGLDGRPFAALSIAALSDRLVAREQELVVALQREARQIADPRIPLGGFSDRH
ncbi:MAG: helix-turn-helix domain-containing protein [Burkholderiales bacterium]|nr:helix-turn-helix domain-containing protein [Burkholderiales bacterium]